MVSTADEVIGGIRQNISTPGQHRGYENEMHQSQIHVQRGILIQAVYNEHAFPGFRVSFPHVIRQHGIE